MTHLRLITSLVLVASGEEKQAWREGDLLGDHWDTLQVRNYGA